MLVLGFVKPIYLRSHPQIKLMLLLSVPTIGNVQKLVLIELAKMLLSLVPCFLAL
jgi:hypothetical protein